MAATKYRGVRIVPVKVVKYEVRDPTGHVLHRTSNTAAARAWVNGYLAASAQALREAAAVAAKPTRKRRAKPAGENVTETLPA